jgi:hypothetical protein
MASTREPGAAPSASCIGRYLRRRHWKSFDQSIAEFDPATLARPLTQPSARDFIICGAPRTGTTFLCGLLFQPPKVVTVMQPWDGLRIPVGDLFRSIRAEVSSGIMARGRLDLDALCRQGQMSVVAEGSQPYRVETDKAFLLGIKWPVFYRYIGMLPDTKFVICVRDPVDVVESYKRGTADPGRRAFGKGYANPNGFNREMNNYLRAATWSAARRRILMFDYHYERILPYLSRPNVLLVRHERWFIDPSRLRSEISSFLGVEIGPGHVPVQRSVMSGTIDTKLRASILARSTTAAALGYCAADGL